MASLFSVEHSLFGGGAAAALSVSDVSLHLATLVRYDDILQDLWVRGEVSNLTRAASGHLYFSLKDEESCLSCVMWRSTAARLGFRLEPGMQLLAHGALDVYPPRGQYQLIVDELEPDGAGALHLGLEQAKARLLAEGLLDNARKRPLPPFPRRVAIVTSLAGAAVRDICVTLQASPHPPAIVLVPAVVQGERAPESLCAALHQAETRSGADLVIVGRGGGSLEDLWAFNAEPVARAIAGCRLPVISAVGHETDYTLADMAADFRAPTPTAAAEIVLARRDERIARAERALADARGLFAARVANDRLRWQGLVRRLPLARPEWLVETRRQRLDDLTARLLRARAACLAELRHRFALAAGRLDGVSPLATLARGYATVIRLRDETPVTGVRDVAAGDAVRVRLADGAFDAVVSGIRPEDQPERSE